MESMIKTYSILLNKFIDQIICIDTTVLNSLKVYKIKNLLKWLGIVLKRMGK